LIDKSKIWLLGSVLMSVSTMTSGCSYLSKGHADFDARLREQGIASWYGDHFHGQPTASGEIYDENDLTGAHRTLPFGTMVKVTNAINGLQITLRVNDRGPYMGGRILDLSHGAAVTLGMTESGIAPVSLEVIGLAADQDAIGGIWRTLRLLGRWTAIIETTGQTGAVRDASPLATAPSQYENGKASRPMAPIDIALERRFRREVDIKATDSSGEDGEPELI
jgi:rare lipoprotein A (peptidoglycan hydrolase)